MKRAVLLLLLAPSLFAQHEYIIPMIGFAKGADADHRAAVILLNPTARTAHLRVTGVYPVFQASPCAVQAPQELAPRSRRGIAFELDCPGQGLAAVSISSDEPLVVENIVTSFQRKRGVELRDVQEIDAGTAWVPIGVEALTHGTFDEADNLRANLLLINPNAYALRTRIEITRPEVRGGSRVETLVVAPQSTILYPLAPIPVPSPIVVTGDHDILVSADGPFWAGVSSLNATGGNHFREAVPLER